VITSIGTSNPAIAAFNGNPVAGIYIDAPFVQGSYADDPSVIRDDLEAYSTSSGCPATLAIGTLNGACTIANSSAFSASIDTSTPTVGGTSSNFISTYPSDYFSVTFSSPQRYIGFWWAAGSGGNKVNLFSNGVKIASLDVNQVNAKIGDLPNDFANSANSISSVDGTQYLSKYYYGNPQGYATQSDASAPTSSYVPTEKFVYIHAFALSGSTFDSIEFEGSGFEMDNLATASNDIPISDKLVKVQDLIPMEVSYDSQGGSAPPSAELISFGDSIQLPSAPTYANHTFLGWFDTSTAGTKVGEPGDIFTPSTAGDLTLFAQWSVVGAPTLIIRVTTTNNAHDSVIRIANPTANTTGSPDSDPQADILQDLPADTELIEILMEDTGSRGYTKFQHDAYMDNVTPSAGVNPNRYSVNVQTLPSTSGLVVGISNPVTSTNLVSNATLVVGVNFFNVISFYGSTADEWFNLKLNLLAANSSPSPSASPSASASPSPSPEQGGSVNVIDPDRLVPGVEWNPEDLVHGERVGVDQQNASFSVPGKANYTIEMGQLLEIGTYSITVTFTPSNRSRYLVLSTTRKFRVLPVPAPRVSSSPTPSVTFSPTPVPTAIATLAPKTLKISELKRIGVIYFNNNEFFLDKKDREALSAVSELVKKEKALNIFIEGNTDSNRGVDNVWLSRSRAESVSQYLRQLDARPSHNRLWFAASKPAVPGISSIDMALNRRVEIFIQVLVEKVNASPKPTVFEKLSLIFPSILFNRNEYFLDAGDRAALKKIAGQATTQRCLNLALVGTRDMSRGSINQTIAANRMQAVKSYLKDIYPLFKFSTLKVEISSVREVRVSCTN
jgi:uncharacterized repeat protein (TIGR02543 family)